jgi:hypothetical protein
MKSNDHFLALWSLFMSGFYTVLVAKLGQVFLLKRLLHFFCITIHPLQRTGVYEIVKTVRIRPWRDRTSALSGIQAELSLSAREGVKS